MRWKIFVISITPIQNITDFNEPRNLVREILNDRKTATGREPQFSVATLEQYNFLCMSPKVLGQETSYDKWVRSTKEDTQSFNLKTYLRLGFL